MAAVRKGFSRVPKNADRQCWHVVAQIGESQCYNAQLPGISRNIITRRKSYRFLKIDNIPWLRLANDCLRLGNMLIANIGICWSPSRGHSMLLGRTPNYIPKYGYTPNIQPISEN